MRVARLEDLGGGDDLGQEHLAPLPHLAQVEHGHGHALLQDPLGVGAVVDQPLHRRDTQVQVGDDQRPLQYLEVFVHRMRSLT